MATTFKADSRIRGFQEDDRFDLSRIETALRPEWSNPLRVIMVLGFHMAQRGTNR
jgi:hypothetical protein